MHNHHQWDLAQPLFFLIPVFNKNWVVYYLYIRIISHWNEIKFVVFQIRIMNKRLLITSPRDYNIFLKKQCFLSFSIKLFPKLYNFCKISFLLAAKNISIHSLCKLTFQSMNSKTPNIHHFHTPWQGDIL